MKKILLIFTILFLNNFLCFGQLNYSLPTGSSNANWELVFDDEFNWTSVAAMKDPVNGKWDLVGSPSIGHLGSRAYESENNITFSNSIMTLSVKKETKNIFLGNAFEPNLSPDYWLTWFPCNVDNTSGFGCSSPLGGDTSILTEEQRLAYFKYYIKQNIKWHGLGVTDSEVDAIQANQVGTFATTDFGSNSDIKNLHWKFTKPPMLSSKQKLRFGYYEIKCRITNAPTGKNYHGFGSNFWLYSASGCTGTCYSEIDIFESHNKGTSSGEYFTGGEQKYKVNLYFGKCNDYLLPHDDLYSKADEPLSIGNGWHTYGCYWSGNEMVFYKDGVKVKTVNRHTNISGNNKIDFIHELKGMNIILNIGSFIYNEEAELLNNQFPYNFEIDYVKVYKPKFLDMSSVTECSLYPYWQENGFKTLSGINDGDLCNNNPAVNDKTFVTDVNGDGKEELILINSEYCTSSGSIRVIDVQNGQTIFTIPVGKLDGWLDEGDRSYLADIDGDGIKELVLMNFQTTGSSRPDLLAVDLSNGAFKKYLSPTEFGATLEGWVDGQDRMFFGDTNGDNKDELIFFNRDVAGTAIRVMDIATTQTLFSMPHGTFSGWIDDNDKMFVADTNGDNKDELILINSSYSGGAVRVVELTGSGNTLFSKSHSAGTATFSNWLDANDRIIITDVNNNGAADMVMVNTNTTGNSLRAINLTGSGTDIYNITNSSFSGWLESCDRIFVADVTGDAKKEFILANTSSASGGAIRVFDPFTNTSPFCATYATSGGCNTNASGTFSGWLDSNDKLCIGKFKSAKTDVLFINTSYTGGALRAMDLTTGLSFGNQPHGTFQGWIDGFDENSNSNCNSISMKTSDISNDIEIDEGALKISITPNPVIDNMTINNPKIIFEEFSLFDMNGNEILKDKLTEEVYNLNISFLSSGVYIMEFRNLKSQQTITKKIIKK
ncbi:family 16 glycosylhydrolase [Flavobacterium hauense]